ncbi:MAG: arginine--tRNA ligase, partial [Clostridia bacterium]|nr:arginine--tRNA ligase [Clostridia bacterium]
MDYKQLIVSLINTDGVDKDTAYILIMPAKDLSRGDFSLPCFKLAAGLKTNPAALAKLIAEQFGKDKYIESATAEGGFVNFRLNKAQYAKDVLEGALAEGENYGGSQIGKGKKICMDYSSVNIAKPFHMGHLLNTVLGAALYRIYGKLGYDTVGINHLGDWGTQFGKLITAYKLWGDDEDIARRGVRALVDIYVRFHKEAEQDKSLEDTARAWFKRIEDGDSEALSIFNRFKSSTLAEVERIYK